jgi:hypothetical protein
MSSVEAQLLAPAATPDVVVDVDTAQLLHAIQSFGVVAELSMCCVHVVIIVIVAIIFNLFFIAKNIQV